MSQGSGSGSADVQLLVTDVFLAYTSLISARLLEHWTTLDFSFALALLAIYYVLHLVIFVHSKVRVWPAWLQLGHVLVYLVTTYLITAIERHNVIQTHNHEQILIGATLAIFVVHLEPFDPLAELHLSKTVLFALAIHFSGLAVAAVTVDVNKPPLNTGSVLLLTLSFGWLHISKSSYFSDSLTVTRNSTVYRPPPPSQSDGKTYAELATRISVFIVVRWFVFIYQLTQETSAMLDIGAATAYLLAFIVTGAFLEHACLMDSDLVHSILGGFVLFLSAAVFELFVERHRSVPTLFLVTATLWFTLRRIAQQLAHLKKSSIFWHNYLLYVIGLGARAASYVAVQTFFFIVNRLLAIQSLHAAQTVVLYMLLIVFAGHFVWCGSL